ncbi:hypothetical protein [Gillisia hiemivivida]|jgi:hypothetical protein|uniref:Lipoprotein n=1 Tax=Gillisia hiemivivida TaxID=291190 RepID=A0A5C6ZXY2_9FLAO|nr:hypothetical protein [Gillisia hiemivivida]TXD95807.1 hypothetical protein ES724_01925 [Gillisia hiemivivida]
MRNLYLKYSVSIVLIVSSCGIGIEEKFENSNEILITLYDTLALPTLQDFPPLLEGYISEDSLQTVRTFTKLREEQSREIKTVAIPGYLISGKNLEIENLKLDEEFKTLVLQLKSLDAQPLDLSLIKTKRKDSIIEYKEQLLDPQVSDYLKFDLLISFSRIAFNANSDKAVIIGTRSTSGLAGNSALYFFERKNGKWIIVKSIGIWIS